MGGRCGAARGDIARSTGSSRSGSPGYLLDEPGRSPGVADAGAVSIPDPDAVPAEYRHDDDHSARATRRRLPHGTGLASARGRPGRHRWRLVPAQAQDSPLIGDTASPYADNLTAIGGGFSFSFVRRPTSG